MSYCEDEEILIPEEALKLPLDKFLESYRLLYNIACESELLEIKTNLQKYLDFIKDLTVIMNKYHQAKYIGTWELNEPDILREVWEATKKIVYWDGELRHGPYNLSKMEDVLKMHYLPTIEKQLNYASSIFKNEKESRNL